MIHKVCYKSYYTKPDPIIALILVNFQSFGLLESLRPVISINNRELYVDYWAIKKKDTAVITSSLAAKYLYIVEVFGLM